ncbi:MAG: TRAP transporter large permease subunit [Ruminococcaceae bacterium]|nr:TRAP transporter large permease subunit [Oscillospiraceae bacterium]
MPVTFIYLGVLLAVICIWFLAFKRPIYEAVFLGFIALLIITGTWKNVPTYINDGLSSSLIYSMVAFVAMSVVMTKTKVIDGSVAIILSLLGKIPGGAGYASVIASSFMGALSGSGPGNVMATGAITIPAMKRSGFPAELAANVESNSSYLGNMIPPSSNIVAALGAFVALYGEESLTQGQFWIILWGISLWFVLEKLLLVFIFCKVYKIKPIAKEDRPKLSLVIKESWQGLFLPVIILAPFVLDYLFKDGFFTLRLGAQGANYLSKSLILFIAGIATLFACLIVKDKKLVTPNALARTFASSVKTIAPAIAVCIFGYMIGSMFSDLNIASDMENFIISMDFSKIGMVLFTCILTCFLGMVIPGSSLVVIFGPVFISTLASVGVNPVLAAAMLPCICGVMCGITPPLALGLYAGMSLAESDFGKTVKNDLWWVFAHFILEVVVLMGWLPILGLV